MNCKEFNYQGEAKNLNRIRDAVLPKWKNQIDIPRPYLEYCSQHMLVMSLLKGVNLADGIRSQYKKVADNQARINYNTYCYNSLYYAIFKKCC